MRLLSLAGMALILAATVFGSSVPVRAGGGNSGAAHACRQGGYLELARSDGTGFGSVGECVSYAAHGGEFGVAPVIADAGCPAAAVDGGTPFKCDPVVTGSGPLTFIWQGTHTAPRDASSAAPYFTSTGNQPDATIILTICNPIDCVTATAVVPINAATQCVPGAVGDATPVTAGAGQVTISWTDVGGCVKGYYVYFSETDAVFSIIGAEPSTPANPSPESGIFNAGPNTSFTVGNLDPGKTYYFWVFSYGTGDGQNSSPPATASATAGS